MTVFTDFQLIPAFTGALSVDFGNFELRVGVDICKESLQSDTWKHVSDCNEAMIYEEE